MICMFRGDNMNKTTDCKYLRLLHNLDEVHVVLHWVDYNQHISKISWDDATSVVPGVLRPHDVYLVISQVAQL